MSDNSKHHHHHHHHHHKDPTERFQQRSIRAIALRKTIAKWTFRVLLVVAVVLVIYAIIIYLLH